MLNIDKTEAESLHNTVHATSFNSIVYWQSKVITQSSFHEEIVYLSTKQHHLARVFSGDFSTTAVHWIKGRHKNGAELAFNAQCCNSIST